MFVLTSILLLFGLAGVLCSSVLFSLLCEILARLPYFSNITALKLRDISFRLRPDHDSPTSEFKIDVLIPTYAEPELLSKTLRSVYGAIQMLPAHQQQNIKTRVLVDGASEELMRVARYCGAEVTQTTERLGKWHALERLIKSAVESDGVLLIDCGSVLEERFFEKLLTLYNDNPELIGVAPVYRLRRTSLVQKVHWLLERNFKIRENRFGGPVSVHGAAVSYRTRELLQALQFLRRYSSQETTNGWLNDDIVIPFALRMLFPARTLFYAPFLSVYDLDNQSEMPKSSNRRTRLALGNLQWFKLLEQTIKTRTLKNGEWVVVLLSMRRVARFFWAYWLSSLFIAMPFFVFSVFGIVPGVLSFALLIPFILSCGGQDFGAAYRASLFAFSWKNHRQVWS